MSNVNFIFVRDRNNFPVGCFAYSEMVNVDGNVTELSFGYSIFFLGGNEKFDRARGRAIAQGRLMRKAHKFSGPRDEVLSPDELVIGMLRWCGEAGHHLWAMAGNNGIDESPSPRPLGHRFKSACLRTAAKLEGVLQRKREAA